MTSDPESDALVDDHPEYTRAMEEMRVLEKVLAASRAHRTEADSLKKYVLRLEGLLERYRRVVVHLKARLQEQRLSLPESLVDLEAYDGHLRKRQE